MQREIERRRDVVREQEREEKTEKGRRGKREEREEERPRGLLEMVMPYGRMKMTKREREAT